MKRLVLLIPLIVGCATGGDRGLLGTPEEMCKKMYYYDDALHQKCLDETYQAKVRLKEKLQYYGILDVNGEPTPDAKSKEEYRIFERCYMQYHPIYDRIDSCFDGWALEYHKTGRWGINAPGW